MGNISVNGHAIDAIFLCSGQLSVIDFKDYSGTIRFSENNPWVLETANGEQVFVQGGARMRNPFQQVRAYRFSLMQFLKDSEKAILEGARSDIRWEHTGSIVLFQNRISYDEQSLPGSIKPWFHIADKDNIISLLVDKHSSGLKLSGSEIGRILSALDVSPDNLLERINFSEETITTPNPKASVEKLAFIRRLVGGSGDDGPKYNRLLKYYRTLIQLERFKEPSATDLFFLPLDTQQDISKYCLDIAVNSSFHRIWESNKQENYPKNLFIGIETLLNGRGRVLFYTVLLCSDVQNKEDLTVNLNDAELYVKELENMGLDEVVIEDISSGFNKAIKLDQKLEVLKSVLSDSVAPGKRICVGLSSESMFTAQLQSELTSLVKSADKAGKGVFSSFLHQENVLEETKPLPLSLKIQVTPLNASQDEAVNRAFEQDITVITGPPGTGKSQVVANILANAAMNNHTVLFASKNNKAVDNVKERLDKLLQQNSVLRFGSKSDIKEHAKLNLEKLLSAASRGEYNDVTNQLESATNDVVKYNSCKVELEELIKKIPVLESQITGMLSQQDQLRKERETWINSIDSDYRKLFVDKGLRLEAEESELSLMIQKARSAEKGFMNRLWFDWFQKSKIQGYARGLNNALPAALKKYVEVKAPWASTGLKAHQSLDFNLSLIMTLHQHQTKILDRQEAFEEKMSSVQLHLANVQNELEYLVSEKPNFQREILEINSKLPELGLKALKLKLANDLHGMDRNHVQEFINYLPVQVWRQSDLEDFKYASQKFLENFHVVCVTSLSIKNSFPLSEGLFDMVVIDEASQCDLVSALPMLYRAKKAVIIGDPLQLKHITSVQRYEEEYILESLGLQSIGQRYVDTSLYDYAFSLANKACLSTVFLKEHYRCHPQIIGFSNSHFYEKKLGQRMDVMTHAEEFGYGDLGLNWIDVRGKMSSDKNLNVAEANACIDLARKLREDYPSASIGIVTPFKDQKKYIFDTLTQDLRDVVKVDTVHQYQGDEKDIMILSMVVTDNSPVSKASFLNRNEFLINVAITRAKSSLYIVGNWSYCNAPSLSARSPLGRLASYARQIEKVYEL